MLNHKACGLELLILAPIIAIVRKITKKND